jgi:hypothetical protein
MAVRKLMDTSKVIAVVLDNAPDVLAQGILSLPGGRHHETFTDSEFSLPRRWTNAEAPVRLNASLLIKAAEVLKEARKHLHGIATVDLVSHGETEPAILRVTGTHEDAQYHQVDATVLVIIAQAVAEHNNVEEEARARRRMRDGTRSRSLVQVTNTEDPTRSLLEALSDDDT